MAKRWVEKELKVVDEMYAAGKSFKEISSTLKTQFGVERTEKAVLIAALYRNTKTTAAPSQKDMEQVATNVVDQMIQEVEIPKPIADRIQNTYEINQELSDFIPKDGFERYLERPIVDNINRMMELPLNKRSPMFLIGDASTGKTSLPEYIAYKKKLPFLLASADASLNFNDLLYKVRFENATAHYEPGLIVKFLESPSIILIDELPSASAEIFFKLHELLQEKKVFVKELGRVVCQHEQCYIFAAGNFKNSLYIGNNKLNEALVSRFAVRVVEDFSDEELRQILPVKGAFKDHLIRFYRGVKKMIVEQNKKFNISLRNLTKIVQLCELGFTLEEALRWGVLDSICVNNSVEDKKAVYGLALAIFPADFGLPANLEKVSEEEPF
jgi:midasin (ATPase involved in ribosome maturation)